MIQEKYDSKQIKGWLKITAFYSDGSKKVVVDQHNDLTTNAPTIIANVLGGTPSFNLDVILAYKASALLASSPGLSITFPASNRVNFNALFDEASFNDTLDELRIGSVVGGDFSAVTGLSILKDNLLQLSIDWLLTIS